VHTVNAKSRIVFPRLNWVRIEFRTAWGFLTLFDVLFPSTYTTRSFLPNGQVAQLVERGPEKAGVGGSIPSLATNPFNNLGSAKTRVKISRAYNTRTSVGLHFTFGAARSKAFVHSSVINQMSASVVTRLK
jgi:hypothetical protein